MYKYLVSRRTVNLHLTPKVVLVYQLFCDLRLQYGWLPSTIQKKKYERKKKRGKTGRVDKDFREIVLIRMSVERSFLQDD